MLDGFNNKKTVDNYSRYCRKLVIYRNAITTTTIIRRERSQAAATAVTMVSIAIETSTAGHRATCSNC